jgi:LmbE family N-acetylglucosaminyl deacetylase
MDQEERSTAPDRPLEGASSKGAAANSTGVGLAEGVRAVVVAAHPDDETIGFGAAIGDFPGAVIIHTTDGAPRDPRLRPAMASEAREAYARARREEAERALSFAGLRPDRLLELGAVDQEAAFCMARLASRLAEVFVELDPDLVITHPYEGGHPDHDATALAVHAAAARIGRRRRNGIVVAEMTSYNAAGGRFRASEFIPDSEATAAAGGRSWRVTRVLSAAERRRKEAMFEAFETQRGVLSAFPIAIERLRAAPRYDFTRAPHAGRLHYERIGFPLSGDQFRSLAGEALSSLGLSRSPL